MKGININDSTQPFTELILSGEKTIETRNTNSLRPYVGKKVGIIRTGKGQAMLVGYMVLGEPIKYLTRTTFYADIRKHLVGEDSPFAFEKRKYGYPITNVKRIKPVPVNSRGIVARTI
jgi:hypothetical protein